jgi:hypothetical protein
MGLLADINVNNLGSIFSGLGTLFKDVRTAITGEAPLDPNKRAELEAKLLEAEAVLSTAQTRINEIEAANPNIFVSGWRPAIGWICVLGIFIHFVFTPIGSWAYFLYTAKMAILPALDIEALFALVTAMLGLGGFRTYERVKGVQRDK